MSPISKRRKLSNEDASPQLPFAPSTDVKNHAASDSNPDIKDQRRSLFVRSLPTAVTSERLAELFSESFPLKHATVISDKATGISRGFGFVTFIDADDAQSAVERFNDSVVDGRKIKVELAESRNREVDEDLATNRVKGSVNVKGQQLRAEREKEQEENRPPKLIVRNLPWSIKTSEDLARLFLSYGKVKHAVVPKLASAVKGGDKPQAGFGIVILRGKKNAERALAGVNGKEVDGRILAVDWAVDKYTWEKVKEEQMKNEKAANDEIEAAEGKADDESITSDTSSEGLDSSFDNEDVVEDPGADGSTAGSPDGEPDQDDSELANDDELEDGAHETSEKPDTSDTTIFMRNLPFTADDDSLYEHFKTNFGPVRYARVVYDHETERSRGTAFVSFYREDIARDCVKNAPKPDNVAMNGNKFDKKNGDQMKHSLLQNEKNDPSGKYTLEGRVLQITRALPKVEADRRADEGSQKRSESKRRLYLLSEGTIPRGSKLYELLGKTEIDIRESSAKQRQKLVKENPNLCLSFTRLSIRNIPRSLDSKTLKALAREAIVGFATDVKEGKRQALNKEELARGGEDDKLAERQRREKGKGVVKQVKIVFESEKTGGKVGEGKGGRSRGYGFIEYYGHRHALMGLRWLNGYLVKAQGGDGGEKNKRLIVEFAIENAQVVQRRTDREKRFKEGRPVRNGQFSGDNKRKRDDDDVVHDRGKPKPSSKTKSGKKQSKDEKGTVSGPNQDEKNKIAARNRIIAQKRQRRKSRKG